LSVLTFNVVFEDAGEGWVYAHVPELPAVQTQGADLDDARAMVKDAIALVLEERRARGEAFPSTGWALVEAVEIGAAGSLAGRDRAAATSSTCSTCRWPAPSPVAL
jgi:predicted RNase H-like HicB family nuclease